MFFGYDAMGVNEFIKRLEYNTSYPLQAVRQRTGELKDPTKFLQKLFVEGSLTRFDDKIMEKALINAQLYEDKVGIQVDKAKATLKIDVVDAIIDAMYQAMYHFYVAAIVFFVWGFFRLNATAGIFATGFACIILGLLSEAVAGKGGD